MSLTKIQMRTLAAMPLNLSIRRGEIRILNIQNKVPTLGTMNALLKKGFIEQTYKSDFSSYNCYKKVKEV